MACAAWIKAEGTLVRGAHQGVMVGKSLGDERIGELLNEDPLAVQELQVGHVEPPQVVSSEAVEGHQQQRRQFLLGCTLSSADGNQVKKQCWKQHLWRVGQEV